MQIEEADDGLVISSTCCRLAEVVPDHPEASKLIEAMLAELLDQSVIEFCHKVAPLKCRFQKSKIALRRKSTNAVPLTR